MGFEVVQCSMHLDREMKWWNVLWMYFSLFCLSWNISSPNKTVFTLDVTWSFLLTIDPLIAKNLICKGFSEIYDIFGEFTPGLKGLLFIYTCTQVGLTDRIQNSDILICKYTWFSSTTLNKLQKWHCRTALFLPPCNLTLSMLKEEMHTLFGWAVSETSKCPCNTMPLHESVMRVARLTEM